jgi:hypothetical protein
MKTYEDYLNDPELAGEPRALREVHAMRLKVQDEIQGMTAAEQTVYYHEAAARFFALDNFRTSNTVTGEEV